MILHAANDTTVPITAGGRVIGALGVSGGSSEEDGQIVAVGLAAVR